MVFASNVTEYRKLKSTMLAYLESEKRPHVRSVSGNIYSQLCVYFASIFVCHQVTAYLQKEWFSCEQEWAFAFYDTDPLHPIRRTFDVITNNHVGMFVFFNIFHGQQHINMLIFTSLRYL